MEHDTYLTHLARDGTRMGELARGDLEAVVPTCPGWRLVDLIEHTGYVHRWQAAAVRDRVQTFPAVESYRHPPAAGQSWADWFQAGVDEAVAVLEAVEPDEPCWTWTDPHGRCGWYARRLAQETSVHRVDAELAATGGAAPIDAAFAVDGVTELLDVIVPAVGPQAVGGDGETVHLHATDAAADWVVTLHAETATSVVGAGPADAEIRATAGDLLLAVWGRREIVELDIAGDHAAADRFLAACAL